ncbi:MAG: hypothetical protein JWR32_3710 [Mycobacterium sp.]|jgi:hypothetical protein|nr:hypothetical protein [Mycobacterium sp.]
MTPEIARTLLLDEPKVTDELHRCSRRLGGRAQVWKVERSQLVGGSGTVRDRNLTGCDRLGTPSTRRTTGAAATLHLDTWVSRRLARRQ